MFSINVSRLKMKTYKNKITCIAILIYLFIRLNRENVKRNTLSFIHSTI